MIPINVYGNEIFELPSSENNNKPPISGPQIQPNPLNDCARFNRLAAVSRSPNSVI